MKKLNDFLNSVPMMSVSVIISGFPLAWIAIERVVKQFYISSALLITIAMIACIIAILTYLITKDITRAVTILVVFCPCVLALATPTSIVAAMKNSWLKKILRLLTLSFLRWKLLEDKEMIDRLAHYGISRTVLLTGDNEKAAAYIGSRLGITEIKASLLPEGKVSAIVALQNRGELLCMVGDGVNDAPALKTASVGIAMGTMGSDIAIEAADIAIMGDDISKIGYVNYS